METGLGSGLGLGLGLGLRVGLGLGLGLGLGHHEARHLGGIGEGALEQAPAAREVLGVLDGDEGVGRADLARVRVRVRG